MNAEPQLSGWHGGYSGKKVGGTYGLRFGTLRHTLVEGRPATLELRLEGGESFAAKLTDGFWRHCPEVRHRAIRDWMIAQGISMPWPLGNSPRFPVERIGKNIFHVRRFR